MALSQDVCIETAPNEDFICTRQVLEIREMYDRQSINVGVTQRVDGAEEEKEAIRDVLHQMDMYFFTEVLALPEYSYARSRWYVFHHGGGGGRATIGRDGIASDNEYYQLFTTCQFSLGLVFFVSFSF